MNDTKTPKIEVKYLKHEFTIEERNQLGADLARAIADKRGKEAEFDSVKSQYKAEISEKDAKVDTISTSIMNGFEMRNEPCYVVLMPQAGKKAFFVKTAWDKASKEVGPAAMFEKCPIVPAIVEDMTEKDYQQELIEAESKFENRVELHLFQSTERDSGVLVVGMFNNKWYSALRIKVGKYALAERLDTEQRAFKNRFDAITKAGKRALDWFTDTMPKDAPGFKDSILSCIEGQKEKVE